MYKNLKINLNWELIQEFLFLLLSNSMLMSSRATRNAAITLTIKERRWNVSVDVQYILIIIASKFTSVKLNGIKREVKKRRKS